MPVRYLGVPLISTRLTASHCKPLVDSITARASSWTTRFLSFVGHLQLIKSVLCSIQSFWNGLFILPKKVIHQVEQILRRFLWKGSQLDPGGAKVAWEDLTFPLKEGELGIKKLAEWNVATMGKHLWHLSHPLPSSTWAIWARASLLRGRSLWDIPIPTNSSWTWRKILQLRSIYRPFIKYMVGNGRNIFLWFDNWLPSGPIHPSLGDRVIYDAGLSRTASVAEITTGNSWRWPVANSPDLLVLKEETKNLHFFPSDSQDIIYWLPSTLGLFTTHSAWEHIRRTKRPVPWRHLVWFPGNIPRASFILWLAIKGRLGT